MYLDVKQASAIINIKSKTLYFLAAKKQVPHYRIGSMLRFKAEELEEWMQGKKVEPKKKIAKGRDSVYPLCQGKPTPFAEREVKNHVN